ncbi:MAG: leucine-rich repeat domain-containing protein [Planctomycetota bacterium]|nr:MAG: leucine-rich repeat domain-containing protein [Planctomycetota bacterium]REK36015.1 MAG: leucine-rich repeat domain-containing protein [Planctomycetota bacterium]
MPTNGSPPVRRAFRWRRWAAALIVLTPFALLGARSINVLRQRAARERIEATGWHVVYDDPEPTRNFVQQWLLQVPHVNNYVANLLTVEKSNVLRVTIIDGDTPAVEDDLSLLCSLPVLEALQIHKAELSEEDVALIGSLTTLKRLNITCNSLEDSEVQEFADLEDLQRLTISAERVTDEGLAHLRGLQRLTLVDVPMTRVHGTAFRDFASQKTLEAVSLGAFADVEGLSAIAGCERLEWLVLVDSRLDDAGLRPIARLSSLNNLTVSGPTSVTDLSPLVELPRLTTLTLDGPHLRFDGLRGLQQAPALEKLVLTAGRLNDAGLEEFTPPASLMDLRLYHTSISDEAFDRFEERYPEIDLWR